MRPHDARQTIPVCDGDSGMAKFRRTPGDLLRQAGALTEAKGGESLEFYIRPFCN
jgi:hypothetical protein